MEHRTPAVVCDLLFSRRIGTAEIDSPEAFFERFKEG
jgi:hypothetical protein